MRGPSLMVPHIMPQHLEPKPGQPCVRHYNIICRWNNMTSSWNFVLIKKPTDARTNGFRRKIRSHVTRRQHERSRQKILSTREEKGKKDDGVISQVDELENAQLATIHDLVRRLSSSLGRKFSQGTMAFRTFALHDSTNVTGTVFDRLHLDASSVMVRIVPRIPNSQFSWLMVMSNDSDLLRLYGLGPSRRYPRTVRHWAQTRVCAQQIHVLHFL
nr:hypothetical protein CFP56_30909 [Quercus suber]